ncbi:hypothetical protein H5T54_03750 [Candidatus Bipolaricaulota bacterium]|nr:hypothetical protein [Candidatus Bipolaricaulota bacterium]
MTIEEWDRGDVPLTATTSAEPRCGRMIGKGRARSLARGGAGGETAVFFLLAGRT